MLSLGCCQHQQIVVAVPGIPGPPGPTTADSVIITGIAGENLSGHSAVTRRTDGTFEYASADDIAHLTLPIWITMGAASVGMSVTVIAFGELIEPTWNWTPGPLYLGIAGAITQTVPNTPTSLFIAQIGSATDPDRMFVDRHQSIAIL